MRKIVLAGLMVILAFTLLQADESTITLLPNSDYIITHINGMGMTSGELIVEYYSADHNFLGVGTAGLIKVSGIWY